MGKRLFWIFLLSVSAITAIAIAYIQSESFARIVRAEIQNNLARSLGIELNFDRVRIGVLPPSVSLQGVNLKVASTSNRLGLSPATVFEAGSVGFSFRMIQAFSSGVAINKVFLNDAKIVLSLPKSKGNSEEEKLSQLVHRPMRIKLSDGFLATIRQLEVRNTQLDLTIDEKTRIKARSIGYLALTPESSGTNVTLNAEDVDVATPSHRESIKTLKVDANLTRNMIQIPNLDVQRREAALHASGKLVGSIDEITNSKPDIDIILRGPLSEFADFESALHGFAGELFADLKVVGNLKAPSLQGRLAVTNFSKDLWSFDKIELNGSYIGKALILDKLLVEKGDGRAILKNKLELALPPKAESMAFQLHLENARFEDFAGELRKSVNNLRLRLDGVIDARLNLTEAGGKVKLGSLALAPDVKVRDLELNNQTFNKSRPYRRIFKVNPFQLKGNVQLIGGNLFVSDTKFFFASGTMDVSGSHTAKEGYALMGKAPKVNMGAEVGEISGIPIRGEGSFEVFVHGDDDNVKIDFTVNQQNASFVRFDLGKVEGRVVYDDRSNSLLIPNINGKRASAAYSVSGKVDLGDAEDISLAVAFNESAPDDLFAIFANQLEGLSWIPRGMTGSIKGVANVGGKYTNGLNTLEIDSQLKGRNLSYKGETFQDVEVRAGVTKGVAFGHEIRALKYQTPFTASIDYDLRSDEMRYQLDANKGKLRSLDFLTSLGLPIDGFYSLHSEGKGKWENLLSKTNFDITSAFVRTRPMPPIGLEFSTNSEASFFSVKAGAEASLSGQISSDPKRESHAQLSIQQANFDFLPCLLNRANCVDMALNFNASAEGRVTWKGRDWKTMTGAGVFREFLISKTGYSLRLANPVKIGVVNGLMESGSGTFEGEDTKVNFQLRGRVDGEQLANSLQGTASLKTLEFLTPLIKEARGKMQLSVSLDGDLRNGAFGGGIGIKDGMLRLSGLEDSPLEIAEANLRLTDSRLSIERFIAQLGGGSVNARGGVEVFLNRPPRFSINLYLSNNRIKFFPVNFAEISNAELAFTGDAPPYLFSGTARAKRVMMRNNFDLGRSQKGLQNAKYLPEKVAGVKSFYEVRIRGSADSGIQVENNLLNAEFRGEVTLLNNFEFPQVVGKAELIRGKLLVRNTSFILDHAFIKFPNPEVFEPMFSVGGVANLDNYRINIYASGTADRPKVTLSSYPALPQEDIASLLAFGYRGEETRKINPNDTSAITYSEVGSILLEQLQLSQNLQSKGLRVTVAPSLADGEASLIRPNSAATAAPKVYVQSQVMKNLEAMLGGTVGAAQGQTMDAKVEYRLGRRASVRGVYEQSSSGIDATDTQNSYGADLRFRWEFK